MKDLNGNYHCDWDGESLPGAGGSGTHFCSPGCQAEYYASMGQPVPERLCTRCGKPNANLQRGLCDPCRTQAREAYRRLQPPAGPIAPCKCGAARDDRRYSRCVRCRERFRRMRGLKARLIA